MPHGIDLRLFRKHNQPGPRYTSYPTVPAWSAEFGPDRFIEHLQEAGRADAAKPLSLYVHLPFCEAMCRYCGCNVVITRSSTRHAEYVETLGAEMDLITPHLGERKGLMQLHYGGGTPTFLEEPLLIRLWDEINKHFEIMEGAEVAVEVDPSITTNKKLGLLRSMGFNRLSMGVQDFNETVLEAVGRPQTVADIERLYGFARESGFRGINFDLMYGLPHQTLESYRKTIERVIDLGPDRIALFSYAHLPHLIPHQRQLDEGQMLFGEPKFQLFAMARERLLAAGYLAIGMDHFARTDDELAIARMNGKLSRNFQGYTTNPTDDIIAIGSSAISSLSRAYAQNVRPLNQYYKAINSGKLAICKGIELTPEDHIRRAAISELMCHFELDLRSFGARHQIDSGDYFRNSLEKLAPLQDDRIVELEPGKVTVTESGWPFIRNVAMAFDSYLQSTQRQDKKPAFSKTI